MQKIKVSELSVGQRFDQTVFIDKDNVLVEAGVAIQETDLDRLKKWGIAEVETTGSPMAAETVVDTTVPDDDRVDHNLRGHYERMKARLEHVVGQKDFFRTIYKEAREVTEFSYAAITAGKPFDNNLVREAVEKFVDALNDIDGIILNVKAVDTSGNYLYHQATMTSIYSIVLGQTLGYSRPKLIELGMGAILTDVGMMQVPPHIREKQGKLTPDEFTAIKKHPLLGYKILLQNAKLKNSLAVMALQHHEGFDGSGYPRGIQGDAIEEFARIVTIADSFAAQSMRRSYREPISYYEALKNSLSVDFQKFDPILLRKFLNRLSVYPIGSLVELSTKEIALVIFANEDKPLRPILKVLRKPEGARPAQIKLVDLVKEPSIYIIRAVAPSEFNITIADEL